VIRSAPRRWTDAAGWLSRAARLPGRERQVVVQIAKAGVASVAAWLLTARFFHLAAEFYGPMAALLMIDYTVYRSVLQAVRLVAAVMFGVLLASVIGQAAGVNPVSIALVVVAALAVGQWRRLGEHGTYVAVTAVIMLAFGAATHTSYLLSSLGATAVGAAVGATLNAVVLPPTHFRDAGLAVADLGQEIAKQLRGVADAIGAEWSPDDTAHWFRQGERLPAYEATAQAALELGSESQRLNPFRRVRAGPPAAGRAAPAEHHGVLRSLRQVSRQLRDIGALVGDYDWGVRPLPPDGHVTPVCAAAMRQAAEAIETYVDDPSFTGCDPRGELAERARALSRRRTDITERIRRGELEPGTWPISGALLLQVENLVVTLAHAPAAARPDAARGGRVTAARS
jgi:hypothetical protein